MLLDEALWRLGWSVGTLGSSGQGSSASPPLVASPKTVVGARQLSCLLPDAPAASRLLSPPIALGATLPDHSSLWPWPTACGTRGCPSKPVLAPGSVASGPGGFTTMVRSAV